MKAIMSPLVRRIINSDDEKAKEALMTKREFEFEGEKYIVGDKNFYGIFRQQIKRQY